MTRAAVLTRPAVAAGLLALATLVGAGVTLSPWVTSGAVLGGAVLALCLLEPLAVLQVLLFIGLVDLSLLTGGRLFLDEGGLDMNGMRLIGATLGFGAVALVHAPIRRALLEPTGRIYALFLLFTAATLPLSWSMGDGVRLWFKLLYPFLIFLMVLRLATRREQLERLMDVALAGAAFVALVLNPVMILLGDYTIYPDGQIRILTLGAHQTVAAPYFVLMIIMALTRYATRRQARYLVLAAVCAPWVVLAFSRMAFAEAMIGLLILGVAGAAAARNYRLALGAVAASALFAMALLPVVLRRSLGYLPGPGELFQLLQDPLWLVQHVNTEGRDVFWPVVLRMFLRHPLIGMGLGSTREILAASVVNGRGDVHNEYLRLGAGTGLVGVGLLTMALAVWWLRVVRLVRSEDRLVREFAFPAVAAVVALALDCLTANTFDYYSQIVQYVFFLLAGAMAASALPPAAAGEGAGQDGRG